MLTLVRDTRPAVERYTVEIDRLSIVVERNGSRWNAWAFDRKRAAPTALAKGSGADEYEAIADALRDARKLHQELGAALDEAGVPLLGPIDASLLLLGKAGG